MSKLRLVVVVVGVVGCIALFGLWKKRQYERKIVQLQNEVAQRDKTIEVQKGVFAKLSLQSDDLAKLLSSKDAEVVTLRKELGKRGENLLAANQVALRWKQAYEAAIKGEQAEEPPALPGGPKRLRVNFRHEWGHIGVEGHTLTDPAIAHVRVFQTRPLRLTLVVSQDDNGRWRTYTTSDDPNVNMDIQLSAVNPKILAPKWYEGIGVTGAFGVVRSGFLGMVGVNYRIKNYEVGPAIWSGNGLGVGYGLTLTWRPFAK